jgi:hypothetical protein
LFGALVAIVLLAGCSTSAQDDVTRTEQLVEQALPGGAPATDEELRSEDEAAGIAAVDADTPVTATEPTGAEDRSVIYMVDLVLEADDVSAAADEAELVATRFGGYVQSETTYATGQDPLPVEPYELDIAPYPPAGAQAVVVVRVPAEDYLEAVDALEDLGETVSRSRNAQDVTEEVVDVESRIETQEASIDRLRVLLTEASEISDILAIESELTVRTAELESLLARQQQLDSLTGFATITITFYPPETVVEEGTGFGAGLQAGWDAFIRAIELGVTALGAALPFMLAFAVLLVPVGIWLLVRHRRKRTAGPADGAPQTEPGRQDASAAGGDG